MCGNISNICHRYATSSHPNMDTYNENEEPRPLTYQDAYSLYSWAMPQMHPLKGFKGVSRDEVDILNVPGIVNSGILEVDLEYPKELHDEHNHGLLIEYSISRPWHNLYPLAPERVTGH